MQTNSIRPTQRADFINLVFYLMVMMA